MSILGKLFGFLGGDNMAVIDRVLVGESLVGDGNEVAHVDLIMGPRGSAAEAAFCNALTNNKDGFTSLLAVVAPNLACKPSTILFNKVTIKGSKQAVQICAAGRPRCFLGDKPIGPDGHKCMRSNGHQVYKG